MTNIHKNGAMPKGRGFGTWLTKQLFEHNMTQKALSDKTGITQSQVSILSRGLKLPNAQQLESVATAFSEIDAKAAQDPEPVTLPIWPLLTAEEVIGAIGMIIKAVDVIDAGGDSPSLGTAVERLMEAQMWIEKHERTKT
jgi:transcriptional regulator with XRE-family HTH domain